MKPEDAGIGKGEMQVNKRITILTAMAVATLMAQGPAGQGPRHPKPNHDQIKSYLNLTDSQVQALEQIRQQQMDAVRPMMQQMGQKHGALDDLLQTGGADPTAVGKLVLEIDALQKGMKQKQTSFADQAKNTLTADQKAKLKTLDESRRMAPAIEQGTALMLISPEGGPMMHGPGRMGPGMPGGMSPDHMRRRGGPGGQHRPGPPPEVN
ncbi:MAG TPA: Spy/CpxP family protein refolding chaperone [Bryobacteraceae bacterium]|jgi:Spy/CpxP family protein refolding chaperone|nr:Spy/CpxP family protein refolding chaperone [Bryobacteraceae bacterium]